MKHNFCRLFRLFRQWQTFCDFKEITDISIRRICRDQVPHDSRMVTITRKDDACLVRDTPNLLSLTYFICIVSGFYSSVFDHRTWSSRA